VDRKRVWAAAGKRKEGRGEVGRGVRLG
jgi:hypothetical protein